MNPTPEDAIRLLSEDLAFLQKQRYALCTIPWSN